MNYKEGDILEALVIGDHPFAVRILLPDGTTYDLREANLDDGCKARPEPGEKILTVITMIIPEFPWYLIGARQKQIETYGSGEIIHFERSEGAVEQPLDGKGQRIQYEKGEIVKAKVDAISGFVIIVEMPNGETNWMSPRCFDGDPPPIGSTFEAVVMRVRQDGRCEISAKITDIGR